MEVDAFFSRSRLDAVGRHSDYQKELVSLWQGSLT
jgi:hypothetical protein